MGQKVHPFGFRLGVFEDWHAHWFAKGAYGKELSQDFAIRSFLSERLANAEVSKIVVDKAGESLRVIIHTSRPGVVIGKKGQSIEILRQDLFNKFKKNVEISIQEIRRQELDAKLVAQSIAEQLERRAGFKRVMKKAGYASMKAGARGVKICCSGRLGGAEIARTEWLRLGSVPLHTLRVDVRYDTATAKTTYGIIGIKVWICKGGY